MDSMTGNVNLDSVMKTLNGMGPSGSMLGGRRRKVSRKRGRKVSRKRGRKSRRN